jgi:glycosyltransferase involved in cell wall biosynthesis
MMKQFEERYTRFDMDPLSSEIPKRDAPLLKILFIGYLSTSWIARDFELLSDFHLEPLQIKDRSAHTLFELLRQFMSADIVYVWFIKISTFIVVFLSLFFKKKTIIVTAGYDVAKEPKINYGQMLNPLRARMVKFVLEHATKILSVSRYQKEKEISRITKKANVNVVPLPCDTKKFHPSREKEKLVITVSKISWSFIKRKGLETFLSAAKFFPDISFVIIGKHADDSINYLKAKAPPNVTFTDFVETEKLVEWYQRAKVYCQLSYHESEMSGGAVGEAMACECIPVVSSRISSIREAVGDCGFYVPHGDVRATVKAIRKALNASQSLGQKARKRMLNMFPMEKRKQALHRVIQDMMKNQ